MSASPCPERREAGTTPTRDCQGFRERLNHGRCNVGARLTASSAPDFVRNVVVLIPESVVLLEDHVGQLVVLQKLLEILDDTLLHPFRGVGEVGDHIRWKPLVREHIEQR